MTESEKRANDMWEVCGRNLHSFVSELALQTHMTFDEITAELERSIVEAATDILDGETVG